MKQSTADEILRTFETYGWWDGTPTDKGDDYNPVCLLVAIRRSSEYILDDIRDVKAAIVELHPDFRPAYAKTPMDDGEWLIGFNDTHSFEDICGVVRYAAREKADVQ